MNIVILLSFFSGSLNYIGMTDMNAIIKVIRENPKSGFLYMSPAVNKSSVTYHYYNLRYVIRVGNMGTLLVTLFMSGSNHRD